MLEKTSQLNKDFIIEVTNPMTGKNYICTVGDLLNLAKPAKKTVAKKPEKKEV